MQFTISARGKLAAQPIQQFIKANFDNIPIEQIDSFFGFTTPSPLYGGRIWHYTELSEYDVRSMYKLGINVRLDQGGLPEFQARSQRDQEHQEPEKDRQGDGDL